MARGSAERLALGTFLALALAACGGGEGGAAPPPEEPGACDGVEAACEDDDGCPAGEVCGACGVCEPDPGRGACETTDDCARGTACRDVEGGRACVRSSCATNDDCEAGEACDDASDACVVGDCVSLGCPPGQQCRIEDLTCVECFLDRHCEDAFYPVCDRDAGACVQCLEDADCAGRDGRERCGEARRCVACTDDLDCAAPTPRCGSEGACVVCATDADCPGSTCRADGSCDPGPEDGEPCRQDGSCAPGFLCVGDPALCRASCDPYAPACDVGRLCSLVGDANGDVAFDGGRPAGACVPDEGGVALGRACDDARPCRADLLCLPEGTTGARCRRPCEPGGDPDPCPPGEACTGFPLGPVSAEVGLCSPPTSFLAPCASDDDCDPGQGCRPQLGGPDGLENRCAYGDGFSGPAAPCDEDADCRSGLCLAPGGTPALCYGACTDDADCGPGSVCSTYTFDLPDGGTATLPGCRTRCELDADCARFGDLTCGLFLDDVAMELFGECVPPLGPGAAGDLCTAPEDCASGLCRDDALGNEPPEDGYCMGRCEVDADCPDPLLCRAVAFQTGPDGDPDGFDQVSLCWGGPCGANEDCPGRACQPELDPANPFGDLRLSCNVAFGPGGAGAACDGEADCASAICFPAGNGGAARERCEAAGDEDFDGRADCADPDCSSAAPCAPAGEACAGGADEDGDGLVDCADPDCARAAACAEVCGNGLDDDLDGLTDCDDGQCAFAPPCNRSICYGPCRDDADCGEGTSCGAVSFNMPDGGLHQLSGCLPR